MHGNLTALEAVLEHVARRGVDAVWCAGDLVGKGPRGRAVVELVRERCDVTVRGNWDDVVAHPESAPWTTSSWYRDELGHDALDWLGALPFSHDAVLDDRRVRLLHASATSVHHRVHTGADDAAFSAMFAATDATGGDDADVVVYGDLHDQLLDVRGGRWLVGCGSVGNPLDSDAMAAYVLLDDADGLSVTFQRVAYDVEAEVAAAVAAGSPMVERWIESLRDAR